MLKLWSVFYIQNVWYSFTRGNSFQQTPSQSLPGKQENPSPNAFERARLDMQFSSTSNTSVCRYALFKNQGPNFLLPNFFFWKIFQPFIESSHSFRVIMKYQTKYSMRVCLSQYLKKLFKSVSIRKNNLSFYTVNPTKDTHQIPKSKISDTADTWRSVMWRWGVRTYVESSGKWNMVVTFLL